MKGFYRWAVMAVCACLLALPATAAPYKSEYKLSVVPGATSGWGMTGTFFAALVRERSGIDFGAIVDLQPLDRGTSGRIWRLRIVGTRRTMIIGKELEIRRTLSPSHLYSSAFTVERLDIDEATGVPGRIVLRGCGWGHGVGLCQIGAAVMGAKGYGYRAILAHYFPGTQLCR